MRLDAAQLTTSAQITYDLCIYQSLAKAMRLGNAGLSRYGSNQVRTGPKSQPALPEKAAGTQPVSNGEGRGRAAVLAAKAACLSEAEATWPLQRMLLESVANGSIALPEDIDRFVSRTLASHSGQHVRMQRAARAALQSLRWFLVQGCGHMVTVPASTLQLLPARHCHCTGCQPSAQN